MSTKAGLWIDHKKAIVVTMTDKGEEIKSVISKVEKQPRRSSDVPFQGAHEALQVPADNKRQRALTGYLNRYYDAVIACLGDAESTLVFGPGEAKGEFKKRFDKKALGGRIVGVETVDKMTDRQIAAKVRRYFEK